MLLPPALSYPTRPSRHQMSMNIHHVDLHPTASSRNPSSSQSRMPLPYGLHTSLLFVWKMASLLIFKHLSKHTGPFPTALYRTVSHKRFLSYPKHENLLAHFNQKYFCCAWSGYKSTRARNKSQHATGSENHTVNIMMNMILGRSFWLLHQLGWKPLAQFMPISDMTSICKSKILDVVHLSGTHICGWGYKFKKCFRVFRAPQWQHHFQCQSSCPTKA